jgi:hypothetical protein
MWGETGWPPVTACFLEEFGIGREPEQQESGDKKRSMRASG